MGFICPSRRSRFNKSKCVFTSATDIDSKGVSIKEASENSCLNLRTDFTGACERRFLDGSFFGVFLLSSPESSPRMELTSEFSGIDSHPIIEPRNQSEVSCRLPNRGVVLD